MKTFLKLPYLATLVLALGVSAQVQAQSYNPFVNQGIVAPGPMLPPEFGGAGQASFRIGNTGSTAIPLVANQEMRLLITLSSGVPNVSDPLDEIEALTALGGDWLGYFDWTYYATDNADPNLRNVFVGIQNQVIPGSTPSVPAVGDITIQYLVDESSAFPGNNGFNVNIQPPNFVVGINNTEDDAVSSYTYTQAIDYGDAPLSYTAVAHTIDVFKTNDLYNQYMYLGAAVDPEDSYQASPTATGDDANQTGGLNLNDEDGIVLPPMIAGTTVDIPVTFTWWDYNPDAPPAGATLRVWIDWDKGGTFAAVSERVVNYDLLGELEDEEDPGWVGPRTFTRTFPVAIPGDATGSYFLRARFGPAVTPILALASHGEVEDYQFNITSLGGISGVVGVDTIGDGNADTFESGVTLTLLDENGDPVLVGGNPVTTVTDNTGFYEFTGLIPGSYQVAKTPLGTQTLLGGTYVPFSDLDGGNPNLIGVGSGIGGTNIVVTGGETNSGNNFLEILQKCPDTWVEWQAKWNTDLGGQTGPTQNPDGDRYDNLIEYAFCLPPHLGIGRPLCLSPSISVSGGIDAVYTRTAIGGAKDVTYVLEWTTTLANPTVWSGSRVLDDADLTIVNDGQGGETVTIPDLETFTGLAAGTGFVRIRVDLDDGTTVASDATNVLGWKQTDFPVCGSTYSNPFLQCAVFTGTVSSASDQTLQFADSAGGFDLNTLLASGVAYYLEVETGALAGHRFDLLSAGVASLTLTPDADALSYEAPHNTIANVDLTALQGSRIALHQSKTLDMIFPPGGFGAAADQTTADQVQLFVGNQWRIFWLSDLGGTKTWIDTMGGGPTGDRVIPPGRGMFFNNRNAETGLLAFGEVREQSFVNPLAVGNNLVGGGYPVGQSPVGDDSRLLNLDGGFFGSRDFKTADSVFRWRGDSNPLLTGYDTYFLLFNVSPAAEKWVLQNDATRAAQDAALIFEGDRSVFQRVRNGVIDYRITAPWSPGAAEPPPIP